MKKESIVTLPHARLRERSKRVGLITNDILKLITDMQSAMLDWEAARNHEITVGLAAVQVDKLLRIFIIRDRADADSFAVFINPEITKYEGRLIKDYEGCLSIKDIYGLVPRYESVRVRATGVDGKNFNVKAKGELARILQHETDHTNGVVFIDHIKDDPKAFYRLTDKGNLEKLDYEKDIRDSRILW
jgi:peptide deformylase